MPEPTLDEPVSQLAEGLDELRADLRAGSAQGLLEKPEGVLDVETPQRDLPEQVDLGAVASVPALDALFAALHEVLDLAATATPAEARGGGRG